MGSKGLSINCFKKGHFAAQCFARSRCNACHPRHDSLFHKEITISQTDRNDAQTPRNVTGAAVV